MNKGTYGFTHPPNVSTRISPPEWRRLKPFLSPGVFSAEFVPQNVYQVLMMVYGGGGGGGGGIASSGYSGAGGGGGGFATAIIDVVPGQILPPITIGVGGAGGGDGAAGANGGTSSVGALLSATGGAGGANYALTNAAGGEGTVAAVLRGSLVYAGGRGGKGATIGAGARTGGGGAPGSIFGIGGDGYEVDLHKGGSLSIVTASLGPISLNDLVSAGIAALCSGTIQIGYGAQTDGGVALFAGGAGKNSNLSAVTNLPGGGGGGGGYGGGMKGGSGAVILAWTEGY